MLVRAVEVAVQDVERTEHGVDARLPRVVGERAQILLPRLFSRVHARFRTPHVSTWTAGFFVAIPSGIFSLDWLADLSNIGTLFAFVLVSLGVIVLRRKQPERRRAFRVPWVPVIPILSVLCCFVLMASLPLETWIRLFVWLVIGLTIYFLYGRHHTEFAPSAAVVAAGESGATTEKRGQL